MSDFDVLLNILRTNRQNKTKFCMLIIVHKIYVGDINHCFCKFAPGLWSLIDVRIWSFTQLLENKLTECDQILYTRHIDKIYVGIVNRWFSQICNRVTTRDCFNNLFFAPYLQNEWT